MVADDHPERLKLRPRLRRKHGGRRWPVARRPARPRQTGRRRLDRALRVGQLPGDRLPQRRGKRSARGGLDPVRSAAVEAAPRGQPACPAGRQPPGPDQHAARTGGRLVELRRDSARGLPAAGGRPGHLGAAHPSGVSSRAACTGDAVESRRPPAARDGQRPDPWRHDPGRVGARPGAWKPIGVAADPRPRAVVGSAQAVTVRGRRDGDRRREAGRPYRVHTGLRQLGTRPGGRMTMNGLALNLRGAAVHEQTPARGAAVLPADHAKQIARLRALGATLTRSHYPLSEGFLERADRAGIAVWEEIPFYQLPESGMRDRRIRQKGLDYLTAAIKRDENHPSVIAWSIGNELPATPQRGQRAYIRDAVALAHRLDPARPVALAVAGYPTKNYFSAYAPLDAIGINDYFGWYPGPLGQIVNPAALGQFLDRMRANYRTKALFVTEFGAEANRDGPEEEKGTYAFQQEFMRFHLATYAKRPWINGAINWVLQDFKVRPNWMGGNPLPDSPWLRKGLLAQNGNKKPAYAPTSRSYKRARPLVKP